MLINVPKMGKTVGVVLGTLLFFSGITSLSAKEYIAKFKGGTFHNSLSVLAQDANLKIQDTHQQGASRLTRSCQTS